MIRRVGVEVPSHDDFVMDGGMAVPLSMAKHVVGGLGNSSREKCAENIVQIHTPRPFACGQVMRLPE